MLICAGGLEETNDQRTSVSEHIYVTVDQDWMNSVFFKSQ
jgi:hypothetical protein